MRFVGNNVIRDLVMDNLLLKLTDQAPFNLIPGEDSFDMDLNLVRRWITRDPDPNGFITSSVFRFDGARAINSVSYVDVTQALELQLQTMEYGEEVCIDGSFIFNHNGFKLATDPTAVMEFTGGTTGSDFDYVQYVDKDTTNTTHLRWNLIWRVGQVVDQPKFKSTALFKIFANLDNERWVNAFVTYAVSKTLSQALVYEINSVASEFSLWEDDISEDLDHLFRLRTESFDDQDWFLVN